MLQLCSWKKRFGYHNYIGQQCRLCECEMCAVVTVQLGAA